MTITVDVIIPSFTNEKTAPILKNCIQSLRLSEQYISFNVILIESNLDTIGDDHGQNLTISYDWEKFNYNHALNLGLKFCQNEFVVLANNDLIFYPQWMMHIIVAAYLNPEVKSFSPWNSMWAWHERCFPNNSDQYLLGYEIGRHLAGWCIVAKREIFKKITLNERVDFWYSDNVYADELQANNMLHALVAPSRVDHITSQTKVLTPEEQTMAFLQYKNLI